MGPIPQRRLEDKIRDLCMRVVKSSDTDFGRSFAELQAAMNEHLLRMRNKLPQRFWLGQNFLRTGERPPPGPARNRIHSCLAKEDSRANQRGVRIGSFRFQQISVSGSLKSLAKKPENPAILLLLRQVAAFNAAAEAAFAIYTE